MTPFWIQGVLIAAYVVLAVAFGLKRATWPLAIYYLGCFVKDFAVLALALLSRR